MYLNTSFLFIYHEARILHSLAFKFWFFRQTNNSNYCHHSVSWKKNLIWWVYLSGGLPSACCCSNMISSYAGHNLVSWSNNVNFTFVKIPKHRTHHWTYSVHAYSWVMPRVFFYFFYFFTYPPEKVCIISQAWGSLKVCFISLAWGSLIIHNTLVVPSNTTLLKQEVAV